jgi:hypothetical protein
MAVIAEAGKPITLQLGYRQSALNHVRKVWWVE